MTDLKTFTDDQGELWLLEIEEQIPEWMDEDVLLETTEAGEGLSVSFLRDLSQYGCAAGTYMPAVRYSDAKETMNHWGDNVLAYIWEHLAEIPVDAGPANSATFSGFCVHWLSMAVEIWAGSLLAEVDE